MRRDAAGSEKRRKNAFVTQRVHVRVALDKQFRDLDVAVTRGAVQRCASVLHLSVDVGAGVEEETSGLVVADVEERGPSLEPDQVDIRMGIDQELDHLELVFQQRSDQRRLLHAVPSVDVRARVEQLARTRNESRFRAVVQRGRTREKTTSSQSRTFTSALY
jgi:hypothetical protein